ncbi:MAG: tripartite tricarboxylate transporter TctB family protein [Burkholderiales bacterium]
MHKADRVTAAVLLAFSLAFAAGALKYYPYWSESGPGSGFLPAWLGGVMAALALLMLLRRPRTSDRDWLPSPAGARRLMVMIGASVLYVALLKPIGMIIASALYLAFVMRYFERHRWWLSAVVVFAAAAANWLVFVHWLKVPFPASPLGF